MMATLQTLRRKHAAYIKVADHVWALHKIAEQQLAFLRRYLVQVKREGTPAEVAVVAREYRAKARETETLLRQANRQEAKITAVETRIRALRRQNPCHTRRRRRST